MAGANLTAIVTGASSGIGRALAVALARQGRPVGAVARRADLLAELAAEVRAAGGTIETAVADVADRAGLAAAIHGLEQKLGPTDLLIANAGMGGETGAVEMNVPQVEAIMRVNFLGVVYAIEAVLPGMIERRAGHVVGISSVAAYKGLPGAAAYCASKAAVNVYLEGLRIELRKLGVAVTAVCPGFVRTPMVAKNPPMPFLMEPEAAAARILGALPGKPKVFEFPRRMKWLIRLARWAPDRFVARKVKMKL
ncbi:SDR family NAD(P)-dependent oxidoreductase [Urbifossiella limnaea]|uniref:Putative oxidoreductase n=1 Tax=Urbifossiella limnaea TaxID=2528023 RepID=A0A517XR46_9BACT|nr:SDR family NAD(P)-dependent oxidoreductase [Urbifossiella limnaea]QDU19980.1 putative oxidoreductase [Urbifossiella limnaea]